MYLVALETKGYANIDFAQIDRQQCEAIYVYPHDLAFR